MPQEGWTDITDWVSESPGEGWIKVDERVTPGTADVYEYLWKMQVVDQETTVPDQRYVWRPQGSVDESDGPPPDSTPLTHPNDWNANTSNYVGTDPVGVAFQAGNGNNDNNASWFFWTTTVERTYTWIEKWSVDSPGDGWVKTEESRLKAEGTPDVTEYKFEFHHPAVTCPDPQPVPVDISVEFVADCSPLNQWLVKNGSDRAVEVLVGGAQTLSVAAGGEKSFTTGAGVDTVTVTWGGGETGIVAGEAGAESGADLSGVDCPSNPPVVTPDPDPVTPEKPNKPAVIIDVDEQVDVDCEADEVITTTTTTTTDWVFNENAWAWVKDTPAAVVATETTPADDEECPDEVRPIEGEKPAPAEPEKGETPDKPVTEPENDEVEGIDTERPKPRPQPVVVAQPEALPTAVDAGLAPVATSTSSPLGQGLLAGGLLMLVLAGALQTGRRERGTHEI